MALVNKFRSSKKVLFFIELLYFNKSNMISMEQLRIQYMEALGQSKQWAMSFRNGKTLIINTYSFEQFLPYYLTKENKKNDYDLYYNRQQYALPNTPKLIILPHKDPSTQKILLLVQQGQYDFEKLIAFHREKETQLNFVHQILQTAHMLSKKYGFFHITPTMIRASKGASLLLWFSQIEVSNEPTLRCANESQMVMNILQLMLCNFLTVRQLQILIEKKEEKTFEGVLKELDKLIKSPLKGDKKFKADSLNNRINQGNQTTKNKKQIGEITNNLNSYHQSKHFVSPKQYFSVHTNVPITSRVDKDLLFPDMTNKNQNSSLVVVGREKTDDSVQAVRYHHPSSHYHFPQNYKCTVNNVKEDELLHKDTSFGSFATDKDFQFPQGRMKLDMTKRNNGMNNGQKYGSEKNKSEDLSRKKKNYSKFKDWNERIESEKFLKMHQKNKSHNVSKNGSNNGSFAEKRRCTMETKFQKNPCWNNLRLTGDLKKNIKIDEGLVEKNNHFMMAHGRFQYPKWTKINRNHEGKLKQFDPDEEEQVMTFRVQQGIITQRDSDINSNTNEKAQFSANQAKIRDSGKSVSTAAHHFSLSSSDRKRIQDFAHNIGSKGGNQQDKYRDATDLLKPGFNIKRLEHFCRNKDNEKLDMKVSKIIEQYNEEMYGSSPSRQNQSTNRKNPIDESMMSRTSEIDRDVSMLFRSGGVDRTFLEGSNVFAGMEKELNRIWLQ